MCGFYNWNLVNEKIYIPSPFLQHKQTTMDNKTLFYGNLRPIFFTIKIKQNNNFSSNISNVGHNILPICKIKKKISSLLT